MTLEYYYLPFSSLAETLIKGTSVTGRCYLALGETYKPTEAHWGHWGSNPVASSLESHTLTTTDVSSTRNLSFLFKRAMDYSVKMEVLFQE